MVDEQPSGEQPASDVRATPPEAVNPQPGPATFGTYSATIAEMDTHMRDLWEFKFVLDKPMDFVAGQYVSIFLPGGTHPLPFSIASSPVEKNTLSLGIEIVGHGTEALSKLKPGDQITMKGPFGRFVMGPEPKVCFLAGGVGVTPFMSMMRWIRDSHEKRTALLLYSCKDRHQYLWFDELEDMNRNKANIKTVFTLTKEQPNDWKYRLGRIDAKMISEIIPDYKEYVFFSCGPQSLIDAMQELCTNMGIPPQNFRREAWH